MAGRLTIRLVRKSYASAKRGSSAPSSCRTFARLVMRCWPSTTQSAWSTAGASIDDRAQGDSLRGRRAPPQQQAADRVPLDDAVEQPDDVLAGPAEVTLEMRHPDPSAPGHLDQVIEIDRRCARPGLQSAAHRASRVGTLIVPYRTDDAR